MSVDFDPRSAEHIEDPYSGYRRLREADPVHFSASLGTWILTRYEDVKSALNDPRLSSVRRDQAAQFRGMNYTDPPDHTRLRTLVSRAFTPRAVERMRARIESIVDALLERALARGALDVVADLAHPLPITVIAEMVGVPTEDSDKFKTWSDGLVATDLAEHRDKWKKWETSAKEFSGYLAEMIARRRRAPEADLLSALIAAEERGDFLGETELIANVILLIAAGNETTTHLISNAVLALLRERAVLDALRADPARIEAAVEELLRFDPPVLVQGRIAREAVELGGKRIAAGDRVLCAIAAANRDPEVFADPDRLHLDRANSHLAFGFGIHYCLGASLARLETQIALQRLLERAPQLELTEQPIEHHHSMVFRGVRALRVRFG